MLLILSQISQLKPMGKLAGKARVGSSEIKYGTPNVFFSEIKELFSLHSLTQKCGSWGLHFACQNPAFCNIPPDLRF